MLVRSHLCTGFSLDVFHRGPKAYKASLQQSTETSTAIYIGHGDNVARTHAWLPSSRLETLLKIMLCPIASSGRHTCMLGSCHFNRRWLPKCMDGVVLDCRQSAAWDRMVHHQNIKTLALHYLISTVFFCSWTLYNTTPVTSTVCHSLKQPVYAWAIVMVTVYLFESSNSKSSSKSSIVLFLQSSYTIDYSLVSGFRSAFFTTLNKTFLIFNSAHFLSWISRHFRLVHW